MQGSSQFRLLAERRFGPFFVDALVIAAAVRRPVRFVMDHRIFGIPVLNFVFRTGKAIPIASSKEDPEMMERAFAEVANALREGGP